MIHFIKTPDKSGLEPDYTVVRVTSKTNQFSTEDIIELFESFLLAIGFSKINIESELTKYACENCPHTKD